MTVLEEDYLSALSDMANSDFPGVAEVDLNAVKANISALQNYAGDTKIMAIVKADAYGHGRTAVALAALDSGIEWLGVSQVSEAICLRESLDELGVSRRAARIFTWLASPEVDWSAALCAGLEVSASSTRVLRQIAKAAETVGIVAPVHLKTDVGMSRAGATEADFPALVALAKELSDSKIIRVIGLWSHLSQADDPYGPGKTVTDRQIQRFHKAEAVLTEAGITPEVRHLAATAGTVWHPEAHFDLVRVGIGLYGLSPNPAQSDSAQLGLTPVLSLRAPLVLVKQLPQGEAVSYAGTWQTDQPNWVGLVPLGYADGIPRAASNKGQVTVIDSEGRRTRTKVVGRICMDQFVIDLGSGDEPIADEGNLVVLFGGEGFPSVDDWAAETGTINYEIVARLAPTIRREYLKTLAGEDHEFATKKH